MPEGTPHSSEWDVVIIGSGAGGGTMAHALAGRGERVLLLERGGWLPAEDGNWDPGVVWQEQRYRADVRWLDRAGEEFRPWMQYQVGGNTKVWGAALLRLRESDFAERPHAEGVSPAWPIDYADLAPWYDEAERLYQVHGAGDDPTDPPRGPFPYPAVPHEPEVQRVVDRLSAQGLHPSHLPLGLVDPGLPGGCALCSTCNSFPCKLRAKSDADVLAVTPAIKADNVTLWTGALATRLHTDDTGRRVTAVEVEHADGTVEVRAGTFVLSAGAVNSTAILLNSATSRHPGGLANGSDLVGRNYMAHLSTMMEAVRPGKNPTSYQKTVQINDFYEATADRPALGHIQSQGRAHAKIVTAVAPMVPEWAAEAWIQRGSDWLAMSEDLPLRDNRVTVTPEGRIQLSYGLNNLDAHRRLVKELSTALRRAGFWIVVKQRFKNVNTTHQCGTAVMGHDPATSVLDTYCRAHEVDNLYVVDGSFFPSSGAVNPGLTIIAQTLRVADHLTREVL